MKGIRQWAHHTIRFLIDCAIEGYWSVVDWIKKNPHKTFWAVLAYLVVRN